MNALHGVWQRLAEGGIYMYPIFLLSVIMFAMIMRRICGYRSLKRTLERLDGRNRTDAPKDDAIFALAERYRRSRCDVLELNVRLREEMVRRFLSREGTDGSAVILLGSIAMLLGLLGTVSGMIATFEAIQMFGVGNTKSFAAGIAEALLTTQSGLLVGVVGVGAGHAIRRLHKKTQLRLHRCFDEIGDEKEIRFGVKHHG